MNSMVKSMDLSDAEFFMAVLAAFSLGLFLH